MHRVMIAGAGKIGRAIACLLAHTEAYEVCMVDLDAVIAEVTLLFQNLPKITLKSIDIRDIDALKQMMKKEKIQAVISSLPYFLNHYIAEAAVSAHVHYLDLTEDVAVSNEIKRLALGAKTALVPQCGLAPGFVSIAANSLMSTFDHCYQAKLRVGALPQSTSNALHYSLTWSTDGLINEYGNPCYGIEEGVSAVFSPLEGLETLHLDGVVYEAFNTSGGLGNLASVYAGRVHRLNYKTIRYPGHCEKMRFLMDTLKLNYDRETLKHILERAMPKTYQDMVVIYISIEGQLQGEFIEKNYFKKILPVKIFDMQWSAIQISTASGVCAVLDLLLSSPHHYEGLVLQENFQLNEFLQNRLGVYYA